MQWLTSCAQSRGRFVSACSTEFAVIADGPTGRAHQKHLMDTFRVGLFVAVCALSSVTRTAAQIVVKGAPLGSDDSKSGSAGRPHRRCEHSGSEPRDRRGLRHHKKVHLWLPPFWRRPRHDRATTAPRPRHGLRRDWDRHAGRRRRGRHRRGRHGRGGQGSQDRAWVGGPDRHRAWKGARRCAIEGCR